jgi:hypothetical protein
VVFAAALRAAGPAESESAGKIACPMALAVREAEDYPKKLGHDGIRQSRTQS